LYFDQDLDRYVYGSVTDRFKDLLGYFRDLYADGLLDPDFVSLTSQQWREKIGSGKSYFFYDNPTYGKRGNDAILTVDPDAWWEPTPVLENPYGGRRSLFYQRNVYNQSFALGVNSEVADATVRVFDFLYSEEGADLKTFGIEGEHSERVDGQLRFKDEFLAEYRQESGEGYKVDAISRDVGVGAYGDFTTYIDMNFYRLTWPEYQINWYLKMEEDPAWSNPVVDPPFNASERQEITDITTKVETILQEAYDRIILGDIPLDDFDDYAERAVDAGALRLEEIYNEAQARYEAGR
jgi:ABC-type glycerol-3-phosphate transport system substrate-binding protein